MSVSVLGKRKEGLSSEKSHFITKKFFYLKMGDLSWKVYSPLVITRVRDFLKRIPDDLDPSLCPQDRRMIINDACKLACMISDLEFVKFFLNLGADLQVCCSEIRGDLEIIKMFFNHGLQFENEQTLQEDLLYKIAKYGQIKSFSFLSGKGLIKSQKTCNFLLETASYYGQYEFFLLVELNSRYRPDWKKCLLELLHSVRNDLKNDRVKISKQKIKLFKTLTAFVFPKGHENEWYEFLEKEDIQISYIHNAIFMLYFNKFIEKSYFNFYSKVNRVDKSYY